MEFVDNYAPYSGGATAINNTGVVNDASYNFNLAAGGIGGAGMAEVVSGGTNPNDLMGPAIISNPLGGGGRRRKKSRRLKRSNKTRLNSRSKKSKSRSKVNKVRRSLSKRNRKIKRKSKRSKRSKRSLR